PLGRDDLDPVLQAQLLDRDRALAHEMRGRRVEQLHHDPFAQSNFRLFFAITCSMTPTSLRTRALKSAGESVPTTTPSLANLSLIAGSCSTLRISWFILAMMSGGTLADTKAPSA